MSAAESLDPHPRRLPRKDDQVIAAPKAPGCVSGVVKGYASQRLSIHTDGTSGMVHMEASRFTWSNRRRAWVCWPKDVIATIKRIDQDEARLVAPKDHAGVGFFVLYEGKVCWVKRHLTKPVPIERAKAVGSHLKAYVLSTPTGEEIIPAKMITYDSIRRMWVGREGMAA